MRFVYLDNAATTAVDPRVVAEMQRCFVAPPLLGNAAAINHAAGRAAHALVEQAREEVAALVGVDAREIVWTSGATEANNLAILGAARFQRARRRHCVTSRTEHPAVLDAFRQLEREGFDVTYLKPDDTGIVAPQQVAGALREDTLLVSLMHVNNETGVEHDIAAVGALCHARGVLLHVDAAQSAGKIPLDARAWNVDLLSLTAHKLHGPQGVGALCVRREPRVGLAPLQFGGGQEHGLRSGTLPTHQIVGMGAAYRIARQEMSRDAQRIAELRARLWDRLSRLDGVHLNGHATRRAPGILNVTFEGVEGESLLFGLADVAVSSGSACATTSGEPSYVLRALGRSDQQAQASLRMSLGRYTTAAEVEYAATRIVTEVTRLRAMSPRAACSAAMPPAADAAGDPRYHAEVARRARELPRVGAPDDPNWIVATAGGEAQGALIELSLEVRGQRAERARFRAYGCPHVVASASWLAEHLVGRTRPEIESWDWREVQRALDVPPAKFGRLLTLQDAARALARNWPAPAAVKA
jgi:cysteine desulfurase